MNANQKPRPRTHACSPTGATALVAVLVATASLAGANAQSTAPRLVTVCEALAALDQLSGKKVIIVGKYDPGSMIDGCCSLVADKCRQSVVTEYRPGVKAATGYMWDNRIALAGPESKDPKPEPNVAEADLEQALDRARAWTTLGCRETVGLGSDGKGKMFKVRDQFAVAYGTLRTRARLRGPRGVPGTAGFQWGNGFGHLGAAPAELLMSVYAVRFIGPRECRGE